MYLDDLLVGAAYYAEYQPYERTEKDLDLMAAAGFSVIRVGESVWSTWEPQEGVFDLEWIAPVLDGAHARGIRVIMGTPTYAVPPWLRRRYPETTAHNATGQPIPYGGRQDVDITHPAFRHLAERLVRAVVGRWADHPAVIGWQVDNEPGNELLHNEAVFLRFVEHLRGRYGHVDALNRAWGLTYWSHRLSDFAELWRPEGNTTPSYDLAWRRFQADLTHEFVAWQAELVRSMVPASHFVTTCVALGRPAQDVSRVAAPLDVAATNIYYAGQDGLGRDADPGDELPLVSEFPGPAGTDGLFLQADVSRGMRDAPFLVTETNAGSVGGPAENRPAYPGQWRQVAWAMVARGARLIEYWHWHSLHHGNETFWGGVLGHSLEPGRCYDELAQLAKELARVGPELSGMRPDSQAALLVSADSRWAMSFMSPLPGGGARSNWAPGWFGDPTAYDRILQAVYRGLFDAGLGVDVVAPHQLPAASEAADRWPVLAVPAAYVLDDATLGWLGDYAAAGGHLLLTPRTGYADDEAAARAEVMPGRLRPAAGVSYDESTAVAAAVPVLPEPAEGGEVLPEGLALAWVDGLRPEGARALAGYRHPFLGRFAAVTTNEHGLGRVTTLGALPDRHLAASLAAWVAAQSVAPDVWRQMHRGAVTHCSATLPDGRRTHFLHHWAWGKTSVVVPAPVTDLLSGHEITAGRELVLGPWQTAVLLEHHPASEVVAATRGERP